MSEIQQMLRRAKISFHFFCLTLLLFWIITICVAEREIPREPQINNAKLVADHRRQLRSGSARGQTKWHGRRCKKEGGQDIKITRRETFSENFSPKKWSPCLLGISSTKGQTECDVDMHLISYRISSIWDRLINKGQHDTRF